MSRFNRQSSRAINLILVPVLFALSACSGGSTTRDGSTSDASDSATDVATDAPQPACVRDEDCANGVFCDGEERCVAGHCEAGAAPCDDGRTCTRDHCEESTRLCTSLPDDSRCSDGNACNGVERCEPSSPGAVRETGCMPPATTTLDCNDSNACTEDFCDPTLGCVHAPRDSDLDGYVDRACTITGRPGDPSGNDCDDSNPAVNPGMPEICDDNIDNNCDGDIDTADVSHCRAGNDVCAAAAVLPGPGSYTFTTAGLLDDVALACNPGTFADAFVQFTLTISRTGSRTRSRSARS